jgi:hypothetical protein
VKWRRGLIIAAALATCPLHPSWSAAQHPIEVTSAVATCSRGGVELGMTLKNLGHEPIEFYEAGFPWGIESSLVLVVATNIPDPQIVSPSLHLDDPGPTTVTIQPSQVTKGAVDLQHRFPTLWQVLQKKDLIVFWSYQMPLTSGELTTRASGSVLLSKESCKDLTRPAAPASG